MSGKDFNYVTLSMIDKFCIPVLLYGLEAIDSKNAVRKSIDFAYNSIFVKLFNVKDPDNIYSCQRATGCLPASSRLDLRLFTFFESLRSDLTSPMASQLFH